MTSRSWPRIAIVALLAAAIPRARAADASDTVFQVFRALSALPRGSFKEGAARAYLVQLAESGDALPGITYQSDATGNLIFRVPGTGRFAKLTKSIALQGHLDMVWDVRDAPAGADLAPYFANGVDIVVTDGWLHTRGKRTTLGADNGLGVAVAARYLREDAQEHPPLELIFTAAEEQGLVGALKLAMPIHSPVLLNLDAAQGNVLTIGCLGSRRRVVNAMTRGRAARAGATQVRVSIGGLLGGHSGELIHEPRLNAIRLGAGILQAMQAADPELGLRGARGGDRTRLNVIPKSLEITVEIAAESAGKARARADEVFRRALRQSKDSPGEAQLAWEVLSDAPAAPAVAGAALTRIVDALLKAQNGPVTKEPASDNGVGTSSNLGYFEVRPSGDQHFAVAAGFMARSYLLPELVAVTDGNLAALRTMAEDATVENLSESTPWRTSPDAPLIRLVQKALPGYKTTLSSGGLEPAGFVPRNPELQMVALGATIAEAHSFNEALHIGSAHALVKDVSTLLAALGDSALLREP